MSGAVRQRTPTFSQWIPELSQRTRQAYNIKPVDSQPGQRITPSAVGVLVKPVDSHVCQRTAGAPVPRNVNLYTPSLRIVPSLWMNPKPKDYSSGARQPSEVRHRTAGCQWTAGQPRLWMMILSNGYRPKPMDTPQIQRTPTSPRLWTEPSGFMPRLWIHATPRVHAGPLEQCASPMDQSQAKGLRQRNSACPMDCCRRCARSSGMTPVHRIDPADTPEECRCL